MAKPNRVFKLVFKDLESKDTIALIMGDNYKRFEDHFLDLINWQTKEWKYDDTPEGKGKCLGRVMKVEYLDLFEAKERFVGFGGLKWSSIDNYNLRVAEHNKEGTAYKPCKRIEEIKFTPNRQLLEKLQKEYRVILTKLEEKQDGNQTDGIPPKPKVLGILPTII